MSTRNRNLPPPVEPDLPELDPASQASINNALADVDANYDPPMTDEYMDTAPEDVINGLDEPEEIRRAEPVPQGGTGTRFDFSAFEPIVAAVAAGDMETARNLKAQLSPVQQHVLERASYTEEYTAEDAARDANAFMDLQTKAQMQAQPQDATKARESAQQAARIQGIIGIMDTYSAPDSDLDNLVGPAVGSWAANEWDKWNNPDRYAQRFELSAVTKNEVLEAAKFVKPLSNDERKFLEEMFPRRDDPPQVWRSYFRRSRDILSKGLPEQSQQQGAVPATAPVSQGAAQPPPNLPPTRIDPVTGQTMQLIQNQQGRWVYRMATQQQSQPNVTGR